MSSVPADQVSMAELGAITSATLELYHVLDRGTIAQRVASQSGHAFAYTNAIGGVVKVSTN